MSSFRVTHKSIGMKALQNLQGNLNSLGDIQQRLSSGREISRPSDNPGGSAMTMRLSSQIRSVEQYTRNASDGEGWLGTIDKTLNSSLDVLNRVQDLTLEGLSSGSASADGAREAIASEVNSLRDHMLQLANTKYLDRPVFGGTTINTLAFDPTTGAYLGDNNPVVRTVGDDVNVRVDADGQAVFGTGGANVFDILSDIAADVVNDPTQLNTHLERLQKATRTITTQVADVGARHNRIERMHQNNDDRLLSMNSSLSEVRDVDLPATIVQLQMQEAAYQAALGATQRIIQPSLVSFMR